MGGALEGIRVLDFTWALAGPYATLLLADLGAEVIKVEWPGLSEEQRGEGPYIEGFSTFFLSLNRGKKSIALDLRTEEARAIIYQLVRHVDVVTENFTPGTMQKLGLGYEDLRPINPRLIYASCSGFGQTGPSAHRGALDIIVQALSGMMSITGQPDGPPTRVGVSIGDLAAGMFLAIGILAALVERARSGEGQAIDVAMLDSQLALLENAIVRYTATGRTPERLGSRHALTTPFQAFRAADRWIVVAGVKNWDLFCIKLGVPELAIDPRFSSIAQRNANQSDLEALLRPIFQQRTAAEWLTELEDAALVAPINTVAEALMDPQVEARGMLLDLPVPGTCGRRVRVAGSPIKLSRSASPAPQTAPLLGEHTEAVLSHLLGLDDSQVQQLVDRGIADALPPGGDRHD
jgi:CoA:oxalate CoA-transferase